MNAREKTPIDLNIWCRYIVNAGHITAALMILAHVIWYFAGKLGSEMLMEIFAACSMFLCSYLLANANYDKAPF
ncbi:MAG: hypothetical protein ACRCZU_09475 [Selenomonadaceae bacterium]